MKYMVAVISRAAGAAGIVLGEIDDSPGLQLIGVALVVAAVVLGVRAVRRHTGGQGTSGTSPAS